MDIRTEPVKPAIKPPTEQEKHLFLEQVLATFGHVGVSPKVRYDESYDTCTVFVRRAVFGFHCKWLRTGDRNWSYRVDLIFKGDHVLVTGIGTTVQEAHKRALHDYVFWFVEWGQRCFEYKARQKPYLDNSLPYEEDGPHRFNTFTECGIKPDKD